MNSIVAFGKNIIANILRGTGIAITVLSVISGAIVWGTAYYDGFLLFLLIAVSGFITGLLFVAAAEGLDILAKSLDRQERILANVEYLVTGQKNAPKSVLEDIESNLPNL